MPTWMTDPVAFVEAIKTITGGTGGDSATKEALVEMRKTVEEMKEEKWREQFAGQQKQIQEITGVLTKTLETISDLQKGRTGRTEMDILYEIAEKGIDLAKVELPGLRRDIKEAVGSVSLPPGKTSEQREERKKKYKRYTFRERGQANKLAPFFFGGKGDGTRTTQTAQNKIADQPPGVAPGNSPRGS